VNKQWARCRTLEERLHTEVACGLNEKLFERSEIFRAISREKTAIN
jgi:hypothetical protein